MNSNSLLEYYKECYYHEFSQRDSLNTRVSIPASIIPLLAAGDIYLIRNLQNINELFLLISYLLVISFTISILGALLFLFMTLYNHKYSYIASANSLRKYHISLKESNLYDEETIEEEILDYLTHDLSEISEFNRASNMKKIGQLRIVYYWIFFSILLGILNVIVFNFGIESNRVEILINW